MPWDPGQYLRFYRDRQRPALDLLERILLETAEDIVDLGCGPGHITRILHSRWPLAQVIGVDRSAEMLEQAAAGAPGIQWRQADLAEWQPDHSVDLIYANASLHWLDDHQALFPRLMTCLKPGGCLAVQMPRNHDRPAHQAAVEVAELEPWRRRLGPLLRRQPVAEPEAYAQWLSPAASHLDIWQTDYLHLLEGTDPVAAWTQGSLLVPLLEALREPERDRFLEAYRNRLRRAYPKDPQGRTPFWFRRLFLVAQAS
jgi:trans-aconitate 2-methyltransferase